MGSLKESTKEKKHIAVFMAKAYLRRYLGVGIKKDLSRRPGKFSEREIEYAFLFNHLHLSPGHQLLEVGSGRSGLALVLGHCGYRVKAIDIKPEHPWVTKGDATKLDFKDDSFDAVISISVIEHIFDCDRAISEILRTYIKRRELKQVIFVPFSMMKSLVIGSTKRQRLLGLIIGDNGVGLYGLREQKA